MSGSEQAQATLRRGDSVGRYVVIDRVGVGTTGAVYTAYDPELDRKVALELLDGDSRSPTVLRWLGEARRVAGLSHPHVVGVHDLGTVAARGREDVLCAYGPNLVLNSRSPLPSIGSFEPPTLCDHLRQPRP